MKRLALLGASGHGKVVADMAALSGWTTIEFFDDAWPQRTRNGAWPVVGDTDTLLTRLNEFDGVVVSIGDCAVRWYKHQLLLSKAAPLVNIIHPSAQLSPHAVLGIGSVVMACAAINVDAVLGQACIINTGATVDHDCRIDHAVHISPGAHLSGAVSVGMGSWIGVGSAVKQGISIGSRVLVGAGAVVVNAVADGLTVVGNPARPLQKKR